MRIGNLTKGISATSRFTGKIGAAAWRNRKYLPAAALGVGYMGGKATQKLVAYREGLIQGLYPGSAMPLEAGRFGVRTSQTPAGISGLKFNFRRK